MYLVDPSNINRYHRSQSSFIKISTLSLIQVFVCLSVLSPHTNADYYGWIKDNTFKGVSEDHELVKSTFGGLAKSTWYRPKVFPEAKEIVNGYGYQFERHTHIRTLDQYNLELWRIQGKLDEEDLEDKPVILLWHGMMSSAITWLNNGHQSVAYILADQGYDIWLANTRGNGVSQTPHQYYNPTEKKFWDFSFSTVGEYDVPAVIDYIINETKRQDLTYIGHSMGTSQMFAAMAHQQTYLQRHVNLFIALGPVAQMNYVSLELKGLSQHTENIKKYAEVAGIFKVDNPDKLQPKINQGIMQMIQEMNTGGISLLDHLRNHSKLPQVQLQEFISSMQGVTSQANELYDNKFSDFNQISPVGVRTAIHFGQIMQNHKFQEFDYGNINGNKMKYGRTNSPIIDLSKIRNIPTVLISSTQDTLATPRDVRWLRNKLNNSTMLKRDYQIQGGHSTFMQGKDMNYLRDIVVPELSKFNPVDRDF